MNLTKSFHLTILTASLICSAPVLAYQAGDIILRAGAAYVSLEEDSSNLTLNGNAVPLTGGDSSSADNSTRLGVTGSYMFNAHWGMEFWLSTPFVHTGSGTAQLNGLGVADSKQVMPTLSAIYYFQSEQRFKPYIGAGINYTVFFDEDLSPEADNTLSGLGFTNGDVDFDDSWGIAWQAGFDYALNDKWLLNASVRWIDVDTEGAITFDGGNRLTSDLELDPWVYTLSGGYQF